MHRHSILAALLALLLVSCSTSGPTVPAGKPCEASSFSVVDGFGGARRGACTLLSDDHVRLLIRPEDNGVRNPSAWYAFRLIPHEAATANITLEYASGYHRYRPKISTDGLSWSVVDESFVWKASDGLSATVRIPLSDGDVAVTVTTT